MRRRRIIKRCLLICLILFLSAFFITLILYFTHQLNGFSPWSYGDANPTAERVKEWTANDFNPTDWQVWNLNPGFNGPDFDTGYLENQELYFAPWGKVNWGLQAYSWMYNQAGSAGPIDGARLMSKDGKLYVRVKNSGSRYANGSIIQGWNWGASDSVGWHCPAPLTVGGQQLVVSLDLYIEPPKTEEGKLNKWVMVAASFWFQSPQLPKPLVIDLVFHQNYRLMFSHESDLGYHYQRSVVSDNEEAINQWRHYDLDLNWFINEALKRYEIEYAKDSLELRSTEILIEMKQAEASFWIDNFYLYYR